MKFVVAHAAVIAAVASISTQHQVHGAIIPSDYHNRQFAVEARCPKDTFASSINISHANGTRFECTNTFALGGRLAWGENKASPVGGGDIYDDLECPQGMLVASMKCEDGDKQCALPKIQCKQAVQKAFGAADTLLMFASVDDTPKPGDLYCTRHPISVYENTKIFSTSSSCPDNKFARGLKSSPEGLRELICCPILGKPQ